MGSICSSLHTQRTINGSINEYSVASVSNNAVVLISFLFSSMHEVTKGFSAKKSPSKLDENTINGFFGCFLAFYAAMHLTVCELIGFYSFEQSVV